ARLGPFDPEGAEAWELLAPGIAGTQREAACRQPVQLAPRDRPEIAGAQEDAHLVQVARVVERSVQTEAGETRHRLARRAIGDPVGTEIEQLRAILQRTRTACGDLMDCHRLTEQEARVEELRGEATMPIGPQRPRRIKADIPPRVVTHRLQPGGQPL